MLFLDTWVILSILAISVAINLIGLVRIIRQEKFQTNEAHTNLELINQSLNRLTEIAEQLQQHKEKEKSAEPRVVNRVSQAAAPSKEKQAITMIRQGENPAAISRRTGISRSELEMLIASEKLGNKNLAFDA